jgi:hypothetical protein
MEVRAGMVQHDDRIERAPSPNPESDCAPREVGAKNPKICIELTPLQV